MRTQTSQKAELFARALRAVALGVFAVFVSILLVSLLHPAQSDAATSSTINFQARLENSSGAIVADGNYNVEFKLYNVSTGGSALWSEDYENYVGNPNTGPAISVSNGYLTANLGAYNAFPGTINWNQQLWLTMNIAGTSSSNCGAPFTTPYTSNPCSPDGEMSPRLLLTATPYSFQAGELATTSGSNVATLTFTAPTSPDSIVLPDASGTVCLDSATACGFAAGSATSYIQNATSVQTSANFNIRSAATGSITGVLQGASGQTADILDLESYNGSSTSLLDGFSSSGDLTFGASSTPGSNHNISVATGTGDGDSLTLKAGSAAGTNNNGGNLILQGGAATGTGTGGGVVVKPQTNSTAAFQVQNASSANLFTVDTTNTAIVLGEDGTPTVMTVRGGAATGTNAAGANLTVAASNGTGTGGSGSILFQTGAPAVATAISEDTANITHSGTDSNPLLMNFTVGSQSDRVLVVQVETQTGRTFSGVTYDGIALTQLATSTAPTTWFTYAPHVEFWYLVNPPTGTFQIAATYTTTYSDYAGTIGAVTYYNAAQSSPFTNTTINNGATTCGAGTSSVTVPTNNTNQVVIDMMGIDQSTATVGSGQTQLWMDTTNDLTGASYKQATGSSVTMSWSINCADWAEIGTTLNPYPTGGTVADTLSTSLDIAPSGNVGIDNANPQYTLDVSGSGRIEAAASSTTTFQVQNSSAVDLLDVDTTDSYVDIGTAAQETLLVLTPETGSSSDPTASSANTGAMYYNSGTGGFRCNVALQWENCLGGLISANVNTTYTALTGSTTGAQNFATSQAIPANYCVQGRVIHIVANGVLTTTSTAQPISFEIRLGTTVIGSATTAYTPLASQTNKGWGLDFYFTCDSAVGSSASILGEGSAHLLNTTSGSPDAVWSMDSTGPTTSIATNGALTIEVSVIFTGTASANNKISLQQLIVAGM